MQSSQPYDVCLILEGTYPFVSGGVSTWVHNLIRALPDIRFCAVSIFPSKKETRELKYDLPENFHLAQIVYIHEYDLGPAGTASRRATAATCGRDRRFPSPDQRWRFQPV